MNSRYCGEKGIRSHDPYSPGCQSCQSGTWLCIFLTHLCNAGCPFCPSPWKNEDRVESAFGQNPSQILKRLKDVDIRGISFSGGECFLVFDRLVDWLTCFRKERPEIYYWAYTNGLASNESRMEKLSRRGMNEIRFNIAATGYDAPLILNRIRAATEIFEKVAVEIPSIPEDYSKLTRVLPILDRFGVAYLNLHQYIAVNDPQENTHRFLLNGYVDVSYDATSLKNTQKVKQFCARNSFKIKVNSCTLKKKENQMRLRRRAMCSLFRQEYEQITPDGLLQTSMPAQAHLSAGQSAERIASDVSSFERHFVHPDEIQSKFKSALPILDLFFIPPMSFNGERVLLRVQERGHA